MFSSHTTLLLFSEHTAANCYYHLDVSRINVQVRCCAVRSLQLCWYGLVFCSLHKHEISMNKLFAVEACILMTFAYLLLFNQVHGVMFYLEIGQRHKCVYMLRVYTLRITQANHKWLNKWKKGESFTIMSERERRERKIVKWCCEMENRKLYRKITNRKESTSLRELTQSLSFFQFSLYWFLVAMVMNEIEFSCCDKSTTLRRCVSSFLSQWNWNHRFMATTESSNGNNLNEIRFSGEVNGKHCHFSHFSEPVDIW